MPLRVTADKTGIFQVSGTVNGLRIRKSTKTRDRTIALAIAKRLERGAWADNEPTRVTFEQAALAYMRADGDKRFLAPLIMHFRGVDISTIRQGHIEDAARELYPARMPATWNRNVLTPVRAVINFAAGRDWCAKISLSMFKEDRPARKAADRAWLDAFMANASPELAALALFMFTTGARISEALRLEWPDIDGRFADVLSKTGHRRAVLTREMLAHLTKLDKTTDRVFRWKSKRWVYGKWQAVCKSAGIEYLPPHQAGRHAFGTETIVRQGMDPRTAADLGGWASPRLLLERYAHSENLVDKAEQAFGRPVETAAIRQTAGKNRKK